LPFSEEALSMPNKKEEDVELFGADPKKKPHPPQTPPQKKKHQKKTNPKTKPKTPPKKEKKENKDPRRKKKNTEVATGRKGTYFSRWFIEVRSKLSCCKGKAVMYATPRSRDLERQQPRTVIRTN